MKTYVFEVSCNIQVEQLGISEEDARIILIDGLKYLHINPSDFVVSDGRET